MRSGLICRSGAIAGRMACILAAALLACASSAHSQVIEEGGFPVKGGDNSGEPFSLTCPSRLVVQAGSSIVLSCSATAVPEEGIRYEWESISVGGLDFLNAPDELSPLFMAPSSGAGEKYAYRLTATALDVYETADVTVSVEGFPEDDTRGEGSAGPGDCSSFAFEGYREGCSSKDEGSQPFAPFGGFPGEEGGTGFPFPGSPGAPEEGLPGLLQAGDPAQQTAPYLDCPPAVFLEELEVGSIECHVSDAMGEEFLEYMWEPVGSTTRDYLDNPRLTPEDSPYPSVVAPEAPRYETLESFRSGETTFRYRYRLTATSRATGLSSSSEVEVFVSSSRPSVYCPLEVVVEEGSTVALDCEGVDPLSSRMDYDEDGASIEWEWEGLWGTSTALLDATDMSSALFTAPPGSAGKQYHYIASMTSSASGVPRMARRRVTVRVTAEEGATQATAEALMQTYAGSRIGISCEDPGPVYERSGDLALQCTVTGVVLSMELVMYTWRSLINAADTLLLSDPAHEDPVFETPDNVDEDTDYKYRVTVRQGLISADSNIITVTVKNKPDITVACEDSPYDVDEGDADFDFDCSASDAPGDDPQYTWSWSPTTHLTGHDTAMPTFDVPDDVDNDTTYTYTVTASAANANDGTAEVTVKVREMYTTAIHCPGNPYSVDEGSDRYELDCWVENPPTNVARDYRFTSLSSNGALDLLDRSRGDSPILYFTAPASVDANTTYKYTFTISIAVPGLVRAIASRDFSVTVRDTDSTDPSFTCNDAEVYEGTADFMLDCSVTDEPTGATYVWTARGNTANTDDLSSTTILKPTFSVPADIPGVDNDDYKQTYEYTVTLSAGGADVTSTDITVTVLEKPDIYCDQFFWRSFIRYVDDSDLDWPISGCSEAWKGAPAGSDYMFEWTARGSTPDTRRLSATNIRYPTFAVPNEVDETTTYEYLLTVSAENADDALMRYTVSVSKKITCTDSEVYEGAEDFSMDCSVINDYYSRATYAWTGTDIANRLSSTTILKPTFNVPGSVNADTDYDYTVMSSTPGKNDVTEDVTITVKNKPSIVVDCGHGPGEPIGTSVLDTSIYSFACSASGAPEGSSYTYAWTARDPTQNTDLLSTPDMSSTLFTAQDISGSYVSYYYKIMATADNAEDGSLDILIRVLDADPSLTCTDSEIYEGAADITLDCSVMNEPSGATYAWTARGSTSDTNDLSSTTILKPTFSVPDDIDEPDGADKDYEYTVTLSAGGADVASADITVTVYDAPDITVTCEDNPYEVDEGDADIELECEASGAPDGTVYGWSWSPTTRLTNLDFLPGPYDERITPTFDVPDDVPQDTTYTYTVTAKANNGTAEVTVTVTVKDTDTPAPVITCVDAEVYEGVADFTLDCSVENEPTGATYAWTGTDIANRLSSTTILKPMFDVPDDIDELNGADKDYDYTVTLSASGIDDVTDEVTVTVKNKPQIVVDCDGVYGLTHQGNFKAREGDDDITLNCLAMGAPAGSVYNYVWTPLGDTQDTSLLSATDIVSPTFYVPPNVDARTDYEYTLTVSADNAEDGVANVIVRVHDTDSTDPSLTCTDSEVYEGAADITLDCTVTDEPTGAAYAWTGTDIANRLSSSTILKPTFDVPDNVNADTDYDYTVTLSASGIDDVTEDVTVTVLNKPSLTLVCTPPAPVYEGAEDFDLDCVASGAPAGSEYAYVWTGRGSTTNTDLLVSGTDGPAPTFDVPEEVDSDETYEYTLTVSADNAESATEEVTVTVLNKKALEVACATPSPVYEESEDFALDCAATGAPAGSEYAYVWTGRGSTTNTDLLVSGTDGPTPTFDVPEEVDSDETYEYTLTVSADNAESATEEVTVTVLNLGSIALICASPPLVYEGSEDFDLVCSVSGDTGGADYTYEWTARGATPNTDELSATNIPSPTFDVPDALDETTTYEYLLTASADNVEDATAEVTVTVLNRGTLAVACAPPPLVYEGSEDFALDCTASGAPVGSDYEYVWMARGATANTDELSAVDISSPTFYVPDEVDATTTYEYLLTVSAANAEDGAAEVTVTVLNRSALSVVCADPPSVYEGSADLALDCSASGAPAGSAYEYAWTARESTANTDQLSATDISSPTFYVPDEVDETTTYEYLLTASAENAEDATAEVTVTVLNHGALSVVCMDTGSVYEGSEDITLDCTASGAPAGSDYAYVWTAQGDTQNTLQLSATDIPSPAFYVPDAVDVTTDYEYLLTASAENAEDATAEVTVTVLNHGALSVVCMDPGSVYEGSQDITLDCTASGAPAGSEYAYVWTAQGDTQNTLQLSATDIPSPAFYVPDAVDVTTDYEYLLTASAENMEDGAAEVTVTVLNRGALSVVCMDPGSVYEGSQDITLDCTASGAPAGSEYAYVWTAQGDTQNTLQLSATDIPSPTFYVPDEVDETTTYEYLLTASADNAEDASAEVMVTVLDGAPLALDDAIAGRVYIFTVGEVIEDILLPEATGGLSPYTYTLAPVLPRGLSLKVDDDTTRTISGTPIEVSPRSEYTWQVTDTNAETAQIAFFIEVVPAQEPTSPPVAEISSKLPEPSSLGVTASASPLRFGVQSADTQVSLDPMTDGISTHVSGPYHGGRMTLSLDGSEALDENGEMDLSIELASPVVLRRERGIKDAMVVLTPSWSYSESCEQLSSQAIGGLYTEVRLSESDCRLLRFGGELDLTDTPSGRYMGSLDIILRSGESEETHTVDIEVTVVPVQRVITIGPGGVRFSTSRELPAGLTEEQNLSIYPHIAFLTEEKPNGVFELSNPSLIPLEISVSARFGYTEATENGREVVVEDASGSHLGDLSQVVDIHPGVLVLMPGEKGLVRYGLQEGAFAAMADKGYAAFFDVVSEPRQYVRSDQMPEEVAGDRTARVTMRVPGVYVPGEGASQLRAALLSISFVGSMSATFLLETEDHPFAGEVVAYDGDGRELGRRETLVYTRSRVRIPLDRMPEEGTVFLRFAPRGSGRVPEPAFIEWDAPRRDIGKAEKTPTTATVAGRP